MHALEIDEVLAARAEHRRHDVAYIPVPNVVDVVVSDSVLVPEVNPTAFVFVFTPEGSLVMANNRRRGLEVAGGHIEPGETAEQGAIREAREETGAAVEGLLPVGFFRSLTQAERPEGYRYPFPVSCQQFFAAIAERIEAYVPNDECLEPVTLTPDEAMSTLREAESILFQAALRKLFPDLADGAMPSTPCDSDDEGLAFSVS